MACCTSHSFKILLFRKVAASFSDKLHAKVRLKHIDYQFFDKMSMEGLLIEDLKKDTLLYAGAAKVNITDWFFLKNKAILQYASLENAVVNVNRTDSVWNYQFLVDYFRKQRSLPKKRKVESNSTSRCWS
jgi:hypothetical protein